jgi:squalene-associated FAD-dependent desaturase
VIGAGLAGLAAAMRLAAQGVDTVVHESAGAAGGRCRSYFDPVLGADIDNGAHLLLSGNDAALDYLQRIGSLGRMAGSDRAEFDFAELGTGQRWRLRPNEGRAPWWILDPKRRAPGTSLREHLALLAIFWPSAGGTVSDAMHCGGPLYDRLWRPLLLAALNTEPAISSARLASALVRGTLGRGGKACRPLVAVEGLSPTFVDPAIRFLAARGGKINLDHRLRRLLFDGDRATGLEFEGDFVPLGTDDTVIVAVPPWAARDLVAGLETPDKFNGIVNAHFRISAPKGQPTILGVIGGLTQWLFAYPERLSVTISDAGELMDWGRDRLAESIWKEVSALTGLEPTLPPFRIVKEKRATFAATPQQDAKRPSAHTSWNNVFLAGDWVQTGLPATIEGAVRSGYEAARLVAAQRPGASLVAGAALA